MKNWIVFCLTMAALSAKASPLSGDPVSSVPPADIKPALVVGIVVDQMKWDYIRRYWNDFGDTGFKRLVNGGFSVSNLQYNYVPTYTAPGHSAIYTGTTPAFNGIIGNDWYVRESKSLQYCVRDTAVTGVGTASSAGKMSPVQLLSSTIGDELRLFSNFRSKVIGIGLKDRGAILPAGRMANAAYWYAGGTEDRWITSSWYGMTALPEWVLRFNARHLGDEYLDEGWPLHRPESVYDESLPDNNPHEGLYKGITRPVFPYNLLALKPLNGNYDLIKTTPWGNRMTVEFAKAAIQGEKLGKDEFTDMLCVSFSSTDYIGHQFGAHSREMQDCFLRLDEDIAALLRFLDSDVGPGKYVVFLTADHGGAPTPSYMTKMNGAAGYFRSSLLREEVEMFLQEQYGEGEWVVAEINQQIYLNQDLIRQKGLKREDVQQLVSDYVVSFPGVVQSYTASQAARRVGSADIPKMIEAGYHQQRSGDVIYVLSPGWMDHGLTGTEHGSPYRYDTHVPALFYGGSIAQGETWMPYTICDIAPTISAICGIPFPNASTGKPIFPIIK